MILPSGPRNRAVLPAVRGLAVISAPDPFRPKRISGRFLLPPERITIRIAVLPRSLASKEMAKDQFTCRCRSSRLNLYLHRLRRVTRSRVLVLHHLGVSIALC